MLYYSLAFLLVAIVAGALGFTGAAGAASGIAQIISLVFLALFIFSTMAPIRRLAKALRRRPRTQVWISTPTNSNPGNM
jgi:uncharacterized membrane protein YtjA (UPF0391 family)